MYIGRYYSINAVYTIFHILHSGKLARIAFCHYLYFGEDDFLVSIGMEAWDFDGSRLTYIYLNGKEIETDQLADTQSSIGLEQGDIQEGENTVVAVQYDNDDPSGEIVTYKTASFEVRMK